MTCSLCDGEVTQLQLDAGDAIRLQTGEYVHVTCVDDLSRHPDDAYRRDVTDE